MDAPTSDSSPISPPPRRRRWLRRLVGLAVALVVSGAIVHFFVLPWIVRKSATGALTNLGIVEPRFDVARATLWGSKLTNLTAASGDIRANSVEVSYEPLKVISGELKRITLEGIQVRLAVRDGKLDLPVQPSASPEKESDTLDLPFHELAIQSATATVEWEGQTVAFPLNGIVTRRGKDEVSAELDLQVTEPAVELALPGNRGKLQGLGGVLHLGATIRAAGADVRLRDESWIGFRSLVVGAEPSATTIDETRVTFNTLHNLPLARVAFGPDAARPDIAVDVGVTSSAVRHAASGAALGGISMRIPVVSASATEASIEPGAFEVAGVMLGKQKLDPIRGTLGIRDKRADFTVRWAALPDAMLSADGWVALNADGLAGRVSAGLPPFLLEDGAALASRIPALAGWTITGTLAGAGAVTIEKGQPNGQFTLNATSMELASKEAGLEAHNVNGSITLNLAETISTPLGQRITAGRVSMGTLEWTDASILFRLKDPNELFVNELAAGWLGGRISTAGVRLDPSEPKFDATLVVDRISLSELLALAAEGRARGEGLMAGRLPVKVDWPSVTFGTGVLRSQSATGELQVLDTPWLGQIMDQSDPRFTTDRELAEVKSRILRALTDFEYDRLSFSFAEEPESRGLLRINTHGKGRQGVSPQELDLTLNIRGVDDLLKYGLRTKQKYDELTNPKLSN